MPTKKRKDVTQGSLVHPLNILLCLNVGLSVLHSQIEPGDVLPMQCDCA